MLFASCRLQCITGVYQAAQNMAGSHLCLSCQQVPPQIKSDLIRLREKRANASGGKRYWADGCVALGVYETPTGLMMKKSNVAPGSKTSYETTQETDKDTKSTGI
jgi:hypothetical protein